MEKVCINWEFDFDRHQLPLVNKLRKMSLSVKTMRILSFNDSNNLNQSDSSISLQVIRKEAVV